MLQLVSKYHNHSFTEVFGNYNNVLYNSFAGYLLDKIAEPTANEIPLFA